MGRTKGSSSSSKPARSSTDKVKDHQPVVGTHGYTPEETEAAFFLFMEKKKESEPGLKLSGAVLYWNALATQDKNEYRFRARKLFQSRSNEDNTAGIADVEESAGEDSGKKSRETDEESRRSTADGSMHSGSNATEDARHSQGLCP